MTHERRRLILLPSFVKPLRKDLKKLGIVNTQRYAVFLKCAIGFVLIILLKRHCLFIITLILEGRTVIIITTVIVFIIIIIIIIIIIVVVLIIIIIINYYLPPAKTFALAVPKVEQATRTGMIQAITPYKRLAKIC